MNLRNRIMLLVALGLLIATAPLGVMGLGMVRAATDRVLEERLAMTRATADHLSQRLAHEWWQLGQLGARVALSTDPTSIRKDFATFYPQMVLFSGGIFLADRTGRIVVQEPAAPLRFSALGEDSTVRRTLTTETQQTSPIVFVGRTPVVILAVPVFRAPRQPVGVVGGVIDLTKPTLLTFITGLAMGTTGHAAIVGRDGVVLASTDSGELFSRNEHPEFFSRFIAEGRPLVGATTEDHGPQARGVVHVMAFAPIPSVPWGLGIGQTEEEALGPIRRLRDRILLFELVVLAAALAFAWLDTSSVSAPLRMLQAAAERIAGGDLERPVEVRRADEVGMLGRSFEAMRVRLRRSLEENARLQDRLQSVAMLEERERLAREMHDSVGQVLGYVNTKAQAVETLLDAGKVPEARIQLRQLEDAARDVYADLREAVLSLRTTDSPARGLLPVLGDYVQRFAELSGIETRLLVTGSSDGEALAPTTELHLLRIVQEALTNVRKHSLAKRAWVQVNRDRGAMTVTVKDDGIGFEPSPPAGGRWSGFGLQTMRERAQAIGATLTVRTREGSGTEIEVALPVPEVHEGDARLAG